MSDATFGAPTFNPDVGFIINVSPDKKAFTAGFSGLVVSLVPGSAPIATCVFSFALPLSGADPGLEIPFFVSGYIFSPEGANGHLLFSVNDQSMVVDFPKNSDNDYVKQLNYKVGSDSELRITVFLLADRDSKSNATLSLNVSDINSNLDKATTSSSAPTAVA